MAQKPSRTATRTKTDQGTSIPPIREPSRPMASKPDTGMLDPEPRSLARPRNAASVPSVVMIEFTRRRVMAKALTTATIMAATSAAAMAGPRPSGPSATTARAVAAKATAEPTERSTCRADHQQGQGRRDDAHDDRVLEDVDEVAWRQEEAAREREERARPTSAPRRATVGPRRRRESASWREAGPLKRRSPGRGSTAGARSRSGGGPHWRRVVLVDVVARDELVR